MAWPGSLTTEEQASLQSWMALLRATCGEIARVNNHNDVVNDEYNGPQNTTNGNLSKLDGSDVIPNASGLDGAEGVTKDETITLMSYVQGILVFNTSLHRTNLARAAGETNLIG